MGEVRKSVSKKSDLAGTLRRTASMGLGALVLASSLAIAQQNAAPVLTARNDADIVDIPHANKIDPNEVMIRDSEHSLSRQSAYWVGFTSENAKAVTAVLTVPDISNAAKNAAVLMWVGMGLRVPESIAILNADRALLKVGIAAYWNNGVPTYAAFVQSQPVDTQLIKMEEVGELIPGDQVIVGAVEEKEDNNSWSAVIRNKRTGLQATSRIDYKLSNNAIWAMEAPQVHGRETVLPVEIGLGMGSCMVKEKNGKYVALSAAPHQSIVTIDEDTRKRKYYGVVTNNLDGKSIISSGFSVAYTRDLATEGKAVVENK